MKRLLALAIVPALVAACGTVEDPGDDDDDDVGLDTDGDGIPDAADACPADPEDADGVADGDGCPEADAALDVAWNLVDANGNPVDCGDADTVEVVSDGYLGDQYVDIFDCADGSGVTASLPLDDYDVWVNVLQGETLYAQSDLVFVPELQDGEVAPLDFDIYRDDGFFGLTWNLTDDVNDLTCAEVGAGGVSVLSTLAGPGGTGFDDIFDCTEFNGTTAPLPIGDYTIVVSVLEEGTEAVLGESEPRDAALTFGNEFVDLGNFDFVFPP